MNINMKTHIHMTPVLKKIINFLKIAYQKTTQYFNAHEKLALIFTNCNKLHNFANTQCEKIVNCQFSINSVEGFAVLNSLGLGTDLVPCCYTQINKKNNSKVNQLSYKTGAMMNYINICPKLTT